MSQEKTSAVQARISEGLKIEAEHILSALGLNTSDAIRVFFHQIVNYRGLPFDMRVKTPNAETRAAMEELESGGGTRYEDSAELFATWDKE